MLKFTSSKFFLKLPMLRYSTENVSGDSTFEKPILTSDGEKYSALRKVILSRKKSTWGKSPNVGGGEGSQCSLPFSKIVLCEGFFLGNRLYVILQGIKPFWPPPSQNLVGAQSGSCLMSEKLLLIKKRVEPYWFKIWFRSHFDSLKS